MEVRYCLTQDDALIIHYTATAEEGDTLLNLTNHTYFNLAGQGKGDILNHRLELAADHFTPSDSELLPTGEVLPVAGTPLDFTTPHAIGERIAADWPQLKNPGGYDHNFLLRRDPESRNPLHPAAELSDPESGRRLTVSLPSRRCSSIPATFWTACRARAAPGIKSMAASAWKRSTALTARTTRNFPPSCCATARPMSRKRCGSSG